MKIHLTKFINITFLISLIILAPFLIVSAQEDNEIENLTQSIEEKKDAINEIKESIGSYKEQIDSLQDKTDTLKDRLKSLNTGIQRAKKEIELTDLQIEQTQLEIKALQEQIKFKEEQITKKQEEIKKILQKIDALGEDYVSNEEEEALGVFDLAIKFIKIIVKYDSWSAYAQTMENSKDINSLLKDKKNALEELKKDLEENQRNKEEKKQSLENSFKQLEEKKMVLGEEVESKNVLLEETQANEEKYQALLKQAVQREQNLAQEVGKLQENLRKRLAELNQQNINTSFIWPMLGRISCGFGVPGYYQAIHKAIDIAGAKGTAVQSIADGIVVKVMTPQGNPCKKGAWMCDYSYIKIIHNDTLSSLYLHMNSINVSAGQEVKQGQVVGYSGGVPREPGTGYFLYPTIPASTGPHLHFAVTECIEGSYLDDEGCTSSKAVNPLKYLP